MTYTALARKWRPKTFAEMVGQHYVVDALSRALTLQRLHHAYLFTGTRGVGKTTVARILAKCLCCEQEISATPCGECTVCKEIDAGCYPDLIEVDAASRTRVEETRELLDNVAYLPSRGRFKIYLIDEVHMLSTHSFNALLKTLEEPPAHVKFLFATTDPQKLPATVLSRCLQYHLKPVLPDIIIEHLEKISQAETIAYEKEAFGLLAHSAEGSVRDALSLLEQAIAYGAGQITAETTRTMLGLITPEQVFHLLEAIASSDGEKLLGRIKEIALQGLGFESVITTMLTILQRIATLQIIPNSKLEITDQEAHASLAKCFSPETVQLLYSIALSGRRDLMYAPDQRSAFEMIMLRLFAFMPSETKSSFVATPPVSTVALNKPEPVKEKKIEAAPSIPRPAVIPTTSNEKAVYIEGKSWVEVVEGLKLVGVTSALAKHSILTYYQQDTVELTLAPQHQPLFSEVQQQRLAEALTRYVGRPIKVCFTIGATTLEIPVQTAHRVQENNKAEMLNVLQDDPGIKELEKHLGAKLEAESVRSI